LSYFALKTPSHPGSGPATTVTKVSRKLSKESSSDSLGVPSPQKKRHRLSGPAAVSDVASALCEMVSSFAQETEAMSSTNSILATPIRRKWAIELLIEDGDLSLSEAVTAFQLFYEYCDIGDTFQVIPTKHLCTLYIQEEVEKAMSKEL
jgi:hypothetical protein